MLSSVRLSITPVSARSVAADSAFVDVPVYVQQRNLSCEYASMVIAMGAYDTWISEWTFDELVPLSDNPHWGYRGDINGSWGNTTDYGVYPEALVGPLAQLGFRGEAFYAEGDASPLQRYLSNGVPVVLWLGMWGDQSYYEYASDGTPYKINPGYHVVVGYGYDETGVYAVDPATGST
ncbi:MAG TPA: C39 family peptidase, partial [Thermomicrobiales bacterium]|nr:C39 family peptidase [Thermomicrobiales bacterium]